ncbi:MAG: hypothetical protein F6J93_34485 [Oscillatoria sp. SIO1A7]|nr:hypothetical protein [Oscillatoria sp. SIO1A7]
MLPSPERATTPTEFSPTLPTLPTPTTLPTLPTLPNAQFPIPPFPLP